MNIYLSFFSCNSDLLMTVTTQHVTRFQLAINMLVKKGLGFFDKLTYINHLCRCVAVIKIKRAARLQCHTTRTSQAFTTTQFLGVNDSLTFKSTFFFLNTPFAIGFQSMTPYA